MVNPLLLKTNAGGGDRGLILLEGSCSVIEQDTTPISPQKTRMIGLRWIA